MNNKFGLKDFFIIVFLLIAIVFTMFNMFQVDRQWQEMRDATRKTESIEKQLSNISRDMGRISADIDSLSEKIEAGVRVNATNGSTSASSGTTTSTTDENWARKTNPPVPVEWQPEPGFIHDPREHADFEEGGELRLVFGSKVEKITPVVASDTYARDVNEQVMESLGAYNFQTLDFEGVLAKAWQMDPEGMWLRVLINPRAAFSDGTPVSAEDVRFTFEDFIFDPQIEANRDRSVLDFIEDVEVIDADAERPLVVEFTFNKALFTNKTSTLGAAILPKHFYSQFEPSRINQSTGLLMGSGPYKLRDLNADREWASPDPIVLVRNDRYWAQGRLPVLDSIRYKIIEEPASRLVSFTNKEIDLLAATPRQYTEKMKEPGWTDTYQNLRYRTIRSGYFFIAWQCGERDGKLTPFSDARVRRAMTLLIDRERIVREVYEGYGVVALGPIAPGVDAYHPTLEPWHSSREEAVSLLKEAGWSVDRDGKMRNEAGDPFAFEYIIPANSTVFERIAQIVKNELAYVGIDVNVQPQDWSIFTQMLKSRDFDAVSLGWSANSPESDPKQVYHSDSIDDQGDNFVQWRHEEADRVIDAIRTELDEDERAVLWHEFQEILHEEQPYTFLIRPEGLSFIQNRIHNVNPYPMGTDKQEFFIAE